MLPVNYSATATQRELDKLKNELDTVQSLATGPTGATGPAGPQGATGATGPQGPAGQGALDVLDEDDMASNSDTKLATQQSIKAYVDNVTSGIAVEHFGAVGDGTTDDTSALQAAFSYGLTNNEKILLSGKTYKYSGLLAVVNGPLCVEGQGVNSVLLKADSYTGAAFEVNNTFGILGNFYPNSYDDDTKDSDPTKLLSPSFSQFTILGESRSAVGRGFDFKDRNDMVRITDVNIFHLNGSAIRFTGTFGNLRESYFTRVQIRMCGSSTEPAVDLEMPTFRHTSCSSSVVGGKTRFTLNGQGDDFSGLTGNRKIRVQGTRNDGGSVEWPVESVISNTVVELPYNITSNDPETGEPYGQDVQGAPCTFYRDVDGLNHIVFTDCQIVGCYGTYLRLSHERVNFFRRIVFDNLMVHGSLNKFLTNPGDTSESQQGPVGDLILIEGGMGSVYFRGLRLNTPEVDKTDPNNPVKYAGVRIKPGRTLDLDIPDRIWFSDIDMLNLNNNGEAMFVVEKVKNLSVTGTVAASRDSGTELKVLSDGVTDGLDYEVVSGTSSNIRNRGLEPAFDIADNVANKVFINTNQRKAGVINVKDFGAKGDGNANDRDAFQAAIDYAEQQNMSTRGAPVVHVPAGRYVIGEAGDSYGLRIKHAHVRGIGAFGSTLIWGGDANGTCIQWEAKFHKSFSGMRFDSGTNSPKMWIDATWTSDSSITPKLDWGDNFYDLFFTQTANVADACHMNLPKIINFYCQNMRFQAAPHLIRIHQFTTASANRVFAMQDWTTDFNQLPDGGVKSLFKVDMQGAASLTLALSNARVETRNNAMGSPKAIVEIHNSLDGAFTPGSQTITSTVGQVDFVISNAPDAVDYGDQLTITDDGVQIPRRDFSYDADTKTVTLDTAPDTGSSIVISWAPFTLPIRGISLDLRDMGFQLTKLALDGSQESQEAVMVYHDTNQNNVTSDIQMQNVYLDGFSSIYGGNWSSLYSTPDPSDLTTNARIKFWSTGRVIEKESQQFGDFVKIGDGATLERTGTNALTIKGMTTSDVTLTVQGNIAANNLSTTTNTYTTISDLVAATDLTSGDVEVKGYYEAGVGGGRYKIMTLAAYGKTPDEKGAAFTLGNNYVAVLKHDGSVTDLQFGVVRDNSTDNGDRLEALLDAAKDQGFKVIFTDGIAVTNTPLVIDKALIAIHGTGKLMSYLSIGTTFPEGSALLTINDCGRTNGTGTNEKPFFTGIEKSVELKGFTLLGGHDPTNGTTWGGRDRRAHGLAFTGLCDDMLIDVECRDFKGIGMSLGNANVVKVNAGSFVSGTTYKIAFLGTDTAEDPDEQEANIQARWNEYLSTTDVTYRIGTEFVNPTGENGSELTGAVVATGYTSDTVRESTFENIQIKNCGNITGGYDDPAMQIGSNGSKQGDNNIWFPLLRLIYSRGSALKVIPNVSNRARKIRIGHLFLHANKQLPDPGTDPNGENWHSDKDLIIIGNQGAAEGSSEIASVSIDQVDLVGLELGHKCFVVNTGSSLHVGGFTGNAANGSYYFYFNGADTSSIRNYNRGGIRVGSPVKSTANLIKIDGMQDQHQVSVSGLAAPTVPSGSKKFATLPSGQWVVGNFYVIRDLGTAGNAAWVTYLGQARPEGGDYQVGDTFIANANDQTPLTGAVCGTSGFKEGVEYKILDLGTAGNAAWVTYTGVSKTYAVGDLFTATANDSTLLTGAIVKVPYFPSYIGDIKHINDDNVIVGNIYKPQDSSASTPFARTAFYVARKTTYFQKLYIVTNSALTADDINYAQIQFIKVNSDGTFGGQFARIETKTTGSGGTGDWGIGNIIEVPFTEPRLDEGEGIAVQINKVGSGVVVPHLGIVAELSPNLSLQGNVV